MMSFFSSEIGPIITITTLLLVHQPTDAPQAALASILNGWCEVLLA